MNTEESIKLLARLDERTKNLTDRMETFIDSYETAYTTCYNDHESRLRKLEEWQWKATGIAITAATIGTICGSAIGVFVGLFFGGGM